MPKVGGPAERLWSPHARPFGEPQSLECRPEAWATSSLLCSPGIVGSPELWIVPCPASCVGKSSPLAPRSGEGRDLPRSTQAGDGPGSPHTLTEGCLLPEAQGPCSPNLGLVVNPTMWLQHTQPCKLVEDTASSCSHSHSSVPDQRECVPSRGSHRKLRASPAGPGYRGTPPKLGESADSSLSQWHCLRFSQMRAA